jgi:hypothetical protein
MKIGKPVYEIIFKSVYESVNILVYESVYESKKRLVSNSVIILIEDSVLIPHENISHNIDIHYVHNCVHKS